MGIPLKYAMRGLESGVSFAGDQELKMKYEKPIYEIYVILRQLEERNAFDALPHNTREALKDAKAYVPALVSNIERADRDLYAAGTKLISGLQLRKKQLIEEAKRAGVELDAYFI